MKLRFTKMHGLGNDFVVVDGIAHGGELTPEQVRLLANRRTGVGCDQVLVVLPGQSASTDFAYRVFNADGNEAEQCGNGARCIARYLRAKGLTDKRELKVSAMTGIVTLRLNSDGQVTVDMGAPVLEPADIPFEAEARAPSYFIDVDGEAVELSAVSLGNPHAVVRVDNVQAAPVARLGPLIEQHPRFPSRANVGFAQIVDRGHVRLRVFERGAGETLACGSGACAAVVAGRIQGLLEEQVAVDLPGGRLMISWNGEGDAVLKTGPATQVFEGSIEL